MDTATAVTKDEFEHFALAFSDAVDEYENVKQMVSQPTPEKASRTIQI